MKSPRWPLIGLVSLISCFSCSGGPGASSQISLTALLSQVVVGQYVSLGGKLPQNPNATVDWSVNGIPNGNSTVGTIVSFSTNAPTNTLIARYAAPATVPNPPTVVITVALQGDVSNQASTAITVGPSIVISPTTALVPLYGSQQFSVSVTGETSNTSVTWQISDCATGGSTCGAVSQTGFYKAPNSVPALAENGPVVTQSVTVAATSSASPLFSGLAGVIVVPPNQNAQALPIQLGTSGSNANDSCNDGGTCSAGTLGSLVERGGNQYILTNWHVGIGTDGGIIGDPLVQPGLLDTECVLQQTTTVANLSQLVSPATQHKVDAAIAQVLGGAVDPTGAIELLGATVTNGVPDSGPPAGGSGAVAYINESVAKSGRSTGLTCASVQAIDVSVAITEALGCSTTPQTYSFSGQVTVSGVGFSAQGDSGSLIVDESTAEPVALLFANDSSITLGNQVSDVLAALKDSSGNVPKFVGGTEHAVAGCSIPAPTASARPAVRLSPEAVESAIAIKGKYVSQLMSDPAVQGVGVGANQDASGPALIIYLLKNSAHASIPATIDGLPVRIIETTGFQAGDEGARNHPCRVPHVVPSAPTPVRP